MKNLIILFALLSSSINLVLSASNTNGSKIKIRKKDNVLILNDKNFDEALVRYKHLFVEFYAPWCGVCKAVKPHYEKAAGLMELTSIRFGKVDATVEQKLANRFNITYYPVFYFFDNGVGSVYNESRRSHIIVDWVKNKTGIFTSTLSSLSDLEKFKKKFEIAALGLFRNASSPNLKTFKALAQNSAGVELGLTVKDEIFKHLNITQDESVVMFKNFDEKPSIFDGDFESARLKTFMDNHKLPDVTEFTMQSANTIFSIDIKNHLILFINKTSENFDQHMNDFKEVSRKFKGKCIFIYIDADQKINKELMDDFGLKAADLPTLRLMSLHSNSTTVPKKKEITQQNIEEYVQEFFDELGKPYTKSADLLDNWDKQPVKELVAKNFHDFVFTQNRNKTVVVEFYAPWCSYCKSLAPTYEEFGKKYENSTEFLIAKMDATVNKLKDIKIGYFPTIRLFAKDNKEVFEFYTGRGATVEMLSLFLESHGKHKFPENEDETDGMPRKGACGGGRQIPFNFVKPGEKEIKLDFNSMNAQPHGSCGGGGALPPFEINTEPKTSVKTDNRENSNNENTSSDHIETVKEEKKSEENSKPKNEEKNVKETKDEL